MKFYIVMSSRAGSSHDNAVAYFFHRENAEKWIAAWVEAGSHDHYYIDWDEFRDKP